MEIKEITVNGKRYQAFEDEAAPGTSLVYIKGSKGFIMCGYLNLETAENKGNIAAVVTGIKTVEDMLKANILSVTSFAEAAGVFPGMQVADALEMIY